MDKSFGAVVLTCGVVFWWHMHFYMYWQHLLSGFCCSAFARYPNGVIVHYYCCKDETVCPPE